MCWRLIVLFVIYSHNTWSRSRLTLQFTLYTWQSFSIFFMLSFIVSFLVCHTMALVAREQRCVTVIFYTNIYSTKAKILILYVFEKWVGMIFRSSTDFSLSMSDLDVGEELLAEGIEGDFHYAPLWEILFYCHCLLYNNLACWFFNKDLSTS